METIAAYSLWQVLAAAIDCLSDTGEVAGGGDEQQVAVVSASEQRAWYSEWLAHRSR